MSEIDTVLPGDAAQTLLKTIAEWGDMMTIIQHGGSVFEFKGPFPKGEVGHGFYNLIPAGAGFQGHLDLSKVHEIRFQDTPRGGRESYAFVFCNQQDDVIFKVFLGRDREGQLFANQVEAFKKIKNAGIEFLGNTGADA